MKLNNTYEKWYAIARAVGIGERQLRRHAARAGLVLPEFKGSVFLPKTQLSDFVRRLYRSNCRINPAILRKLEHNYISYETYKHNWKRENLF
jgi:hypothetical protein